MTTAAMFDDEPDAVLKLLLVGISTIFFVAASTIYMPEKKTRVRVSGSKQQALPQKTQETSSMLM